MINNTRESSSIAGLADRPLSKGICLNDLLTKELGKLLAFENKSKYLSMLDSGHPSPGKGCKSDIYTGGKFNFSSHIPVDWRDTGAP